MTDQISSVQNIEHVCTLWLDVQLRISLTERKLVARTENPQQLKKNLLENHLQVEM